MSHAVQLAGLVAAVLFVLAIKGLARPRTASSANRLGMMGMAIAVAAALVGGELMGSRWVVLGLVAGTGIGLMLSLRAEMSHVPELVALLNGFGGLASVLVAENALMTSRGALGLDGVVTSVASGCVGSVTFTGSVMAYLKLRELWGLDGSIRLPAHSAWSTLMALGVTALIFLGVSEPESREGYLALAVASGFLGILVTLPIGGADMPVVIALLNSYSGIAAALTGFAISSNVLIISGAIVGASGIILTRIMCDAMNRSMTAVVFGAVSGSAKRKSAERGIARSASPEEVAMILESAQRVVIVPGYGLAVAQAQHALKDLVTALEARGVRVELAIHPVAGRMPGHMNVLLAEAQVDYEQTKALEEINPSMREFDLALVVGANDIVNPLARTDPTSPIAGMPVLDVDLAKTVVVLKRSLSPGFAGIDNPLFYLPNTVMLFDDAKKGLLALVRQLAPA
ncbi:MAG: NAD(P)(+) transhydrogenase (Re/Si-specific) subunit beta [Deltaproteobacteria bacterium]|nr:NAD(P)(+) transhydrogenase (Re/Si-specific) subunit beta [Deltaproteobacteria bacterium]